MVATTPITVSDLHELDVDSRVELVEGALVAMSPAGSRHGVVIRALERRLDAFLGDRVDIQRFGGEVGYIIARSPDTVLVPDMVLLGERQVGLLREAGDGPAPFAPLVAIEVKSPSESETMISRKTALYLAGGVREIWWVRPNERQITIYRPDRAPRTIDEAGTLESPDILPGFALPLAMLFAD